MRSLLLFLFFTFGLTIAFGQTLSSAKEISIQIEEDDFNDSSAVNFFIGELCQYLQSQGVETTINRRLSHTYDCQNELYVFVALSYNQYLASNGCWSWHYSNISLGLIDGCGNKTEIFLDDINVPNLRGHLVDKFKKKLKNK